MVCSYGITSDGFGVSSVPCIGRCRIGDKVHQERRRLSKSARYCIGLGTVGSWCTWELIQLYNIITSHNQLVFSVREFSFKRLRYLNCDPLSCIDISNVLLLKAMGIS